MQLLHDLIALLRDPGPIIQWGGYPALALIIFLETGALVAFLPGDSLLFVAGLYAAKGDLNIVVLNLLLATMAIAGDATSYTIGSKVGPRIFNRPDSRWLKPAHIQAAKPSTRSTAARRSSSRASCRSSAPSCRSSRALRAWATGSFALFNITGGHRLGFVDDAGRILSRHALPDLGRHVEKVIVVIVPSRSLPMVIEYFKARARAKASASQG